MQLNLLTRFGPRAAAFRRDPPSTVPGAWRDSAISQLEALAAADKRRAAQALRRRLARAVALGGAVLFVGAALWRPPAGEPRGRATATAQTRPVVAPTPPAAPPATTPIPAAPMLAMRADAPSPGTPTVVADAVPVVAATADDEAARQARAAQAARRKAALLAKERARADEEAQQQQLRAQAQREAAEHAQQQQLLAVAAAEQARRQGVLQAQPVRRSVREQCANSGGLFAEQACQARSCSKAEQQGDAVCVGLREIELARLVRGADH